MALTSVLAFALAVRRKSGLERIVFVLLLSFPLVGVYGFQFPEMELLWLMTFLISIPLLALYISGGVGSHTDETTGIIIKTVPSGGS